MPSLRWSCLTADPLEPTLSVAARWEAGAGADPLSAARAAPEVAAIDAAAAIARVRPRSRRRLRRTAVRRRSCDRCSDARQRAGAAKSSLGDIGTSLSRAYGVS